MKCPNCKSTNIVEKVMDTMEAWGSPLVCEVAYDCGECGHGVNYWAYGSYQDETNI